MKHAHILFLLAITLAIAPASDVAAQPSKEPYKRMPWHLADIWWDLGSDARFESYSIDVTIHDDIDPKIKLYIAPVGLAQLNDSKFYGGIQTQADAHTKTDRAVRSIGPGLLMSMWGERSLDAIRPAEGGYCQSSGHEGDFISVRRPYVWAKGTYTYRVVRMDEEKIDDKSYTWVGAFLYSHAKDENIFIGALRFPGKELTLSRKVASFLEIYGREIPVESIPQARITFGNLRVNGEAVREPAAYVYYQAGVPDYARVVAKDGQLEATLGQHVPDRGSRKEQLLPVRR